MLFPEKLRELRKSSGMRQREIASRLGVDIPMYSRYEHGERRPKREQVVKLARIFKTDPSELVAMWLASGAMSEMGGGPLAEKALGYLREQLGVEAPAAAPEPQVVERVVEVPAAEPEPQYKVDIPVVDPSQRVIVRELGNSPFPVYYEGDALQVLSRIEDESIDCVMTAPPYWRLRNFTTDHITADNAEQYIAQIVAVMSQVKRVLKPTGSLWLNIDDAYNNKSLLGLPWRVALKLIDEQGWILRNDVVWNKQSSSFDSATDHLRNFHEMIFHLVKSDDFYYDDEEFRTYFNNLAQKKTAAGKTSTGVTGARYRANVLSSTALSDDEKKRAIAELDRVVAMVNNGEIPDFRMFLRSREGEVIDSKSEKAKSINEKGYYFLLYNKNGVMPGDVWDILPEKSNIERYNVFPEALCRLVISATCPDFGIVLDPYCGLGTTCKVAYDMHRRAIGIDVDGSYIKQARKRVQSQPLSMF